MTVRIHKPLVALVTDAVAPYHHGGKEQRTANIASHLKSYADVRIYTMKWWSDDEDVHVTEDGVKLHAIAPRRNLYSGERRSVRQAIVFALYCFRLLWIRFDAIEVDSIPIFPLFTAKLVCILRRKELVSTWHEVWGGDYWRDYLGASLGAFAAALETAAIRLPNHIVAASGHTAQRLRPLMRSSQRLSVSRSGIDLPIVTQARPSPQSSELCVVGRLLQHKRIDLLIDAVAVLRRDGLNCRTVVIGSGPEAARLQGQAEIRGVADLVSFRADVQETLDVYALLKSSKVFVFPSEREGFGIAVLEAIACGLRVVTTSAADNAAKELVATSGFGIICDPTAESIAKAVRVQLELASDGIGPPDGWLERFSWQRVAAELAEVLQCA